MKEKLKNVLIVVLTLGFITTLADNLGFVSNNTVVASTTNAYCEKCIRLKKAVRDVMYVVEEDNPDYVMDVLSETDEYLILTDLIGDLNLVHIPDSNYRKLRNVFPDIPSEQAKPDKQIKKVENEYIKLNNYNSSKEP